MYKFYICCNFMRRISKFFVRLSFFCFYRLFLSKDPKDLCERENINYILLNTGYLFCISGIFSKF